MDGDPLLNCTNLTKPELQTITLTGSITAGVCLLLCLCTLVLICYHRACQTVLQRQFLYLTVSAVGFLGSFALNIEHYFEPYSGHTELCKVIGYLTQYTAFMLYIFAFGITFSLFRKVYRVYKPRHSIPFVSEERSRAYQCREVYLVILLFTAPLLLAVIPFIHDNYGDVGPWCWIKQINKDCSRRSEAILEQFVLAFIPAAGLLFCNVALTLFILGFFIWMYTRKQYSTKSKIKVLLILLLVTSLFLLVIVCWIGVTIYTHIQPGSFAGWMAYGICTPLIVGVFAILTGFLVYHTYFAKVGLFLSAVVDCCRCKRSQSIRNMRQPVRGETVEEKTIGKSERVSYPSYTCTYLEHSNNGGSEQEPLLVRNA